MEPENSNASSVSISVPNPNVPQVGIGTVEPEKEKNPPQENVEIHDQSYDKAPVMISENEESSGSPSKCQSCDMSFGDFMDIFDQEIEEPPFTLLHEEEDAVHDNMISDILNMETPNLEMMLIEDFNMDHLTPEDEASRKRKSSEMEADGQMSANMPKTMIETNQQFGAGRVEPEKEKNPPQENDGKEVVEYVDKSAFKGTLFSRQYIHRGSNDILQVGQQYKSKIKETVQEHINRGIRFYIVYEVELEKYGDGEEDDNKTVHLHSANRRILNMYEFDDVYEQAMTKINDQFEVWMGEGSGWVMDRINSISLNIARMKY